MTSQTDALIMELLRDGPMTTKQINARLHPDEKPWEHINNLTHVYNRLTKLLRDHEVSKTVVGRQARWELVVA
jgi:hypothetical protein